MEKTILITGAAGYIASHFGEELIQQGLGLAPSSVQLIFLDNLFTGHVQFIEKLKDQAVQKSYPEPVFLHLDLLDSQKLETAFLKYKPDAVLHFAALISVAESVANPDLYLKNNVQGTKNLLHAMKQTGTRNLIFSSTAAVYGTVKDEKQAKEPLLESTGLGAINPYGESKLLIEEAIANSVKNDGFSAFIFRYFNAAGASVSGHFGEWHEPETHLIPLVLQAALNEKSLSVYGTDYDTRDGSCVRDYVHVTDLARAHLIALQKLVNQNANGLRIYNLGSERGSTVLEVIQAAEKITKKPISYAVRERRPGDSAILIADSQKARTELGWAPQFSEIQLILQTAFNWELKNKHHQ